MLSIVPNSSATASIRLAGLADIPAIARITAEGPQPADFEPAAMSRATRLLLTHVAFEHGALWVEQMDGGPITRAVMAIPAGHLPQQRSILGRVSGQLGRPPTPLPAAALGFPDSILAELSSARSWWVLIEISKPSQNRIGDPALLGTALRWVRAQSASGCDRVMVLTDTMPERAAAESLGFVEVGSGGQDWPWWLGMSDPVTQAIGL